MNTNSNDTLKQIITADIATGVTHGSLEMALKTATPIESLVIRKIMVQNNEVIQAIAELVYAMKKEKPTCAG